MAGGPDVSRRLSRDERGHLRRYLKRKQRVGRYRVTACQRALARCAADLLDRLDVSRAGQPCIVPVDTRQRISEAVSRRGARPIVLFDQGHLDALHWQLGLAKRRERGRFAWAELMIRGAEAAMVARTPDDALRMAELCHRGLDRTARADGTWPDLKRPQAPLSSADPDMPIDVFLAGVEREEQGVPALIGAFVLGHEIGHLLPANSEIVHAALAVIRDGRSRVGIFRPLAEGGVEYVFDARGDVGATRTTQRQDLADLPALVRRLEQEWQADHVGLLLASDIAIARGLDAEFLLEFVFDPLFVSLEMDALMRGLVGRIPRKGKGGTVRFTPSRARSRTRILYRLVRAIRGGDVPAPPAVRAFWASVEEDDLSAEAIERLELPLAFAEEIHRRAVLEALMPEVPPSPEAMLRQYPSAIRAQMLHLRPLTVDPAFFDEASLEPQSGLSPRNISLAAFGQAVRDAAWCLWDPDGFDASVGTVYRDLGRRCAEPSVWELIQKPGLDVIDRVVRFPPEA